ncbi:MAG: hypothetical protein R3E77_13905 [Steroidobacteraceae bacterium]
MKRNRITTPLALAALGMAIGPLANAKPCKDVVFNVTNNHFEGREIEIRQVKFRNPHKGGKQQTEDVKNVWCDPGATCSTLGDNLADADKVDLYDIQVVFKYREHDGGMSKEFVTQPFTPTYRKCKEGKQYGPIVVTDSP